MAGTQHSLQSIQQSFVRQQSLTLSAKLHTPFFPTVAVPTCSMGSRGAVTGASDTVANAADAKVSSFWRLKLYSMWWKRCINCITHTVLTPTKQQPSCCQLHRAKLCCKQPAFYLLAGGAGRAQGSTSLSSSTLILFVLSYFSLVSYFFILRLLHFLSLIYHLPFLALGFQTQNISPSKILVEIQGRKFWSHKIFLFFQNLIQIVSCK